MLDKPPHPCDVEGCSNPAVPGEPSLGILPEPSLPESIPSRHRRGISDRRITPMNRTLAGLAIAMGLASAATAWAVPPTITRNDPLRGPSRRRHRGHDRRHSSGGHAGTGRPVRVHARAVPGARSRSEPMEGDPHRRPGTAVGVYPIRVRTEDGLSNPLLFAVGQLPQVAEKEDNGTFETAQPISVPAVVEGQAAGNDVDYFRFAGKKGQRIVVDAQCCAGSARGSTRRSG